jgi:hypothetical protein
MKRMFKEAADIAKSVPPEFREAAFNRALDMLSGERKAAAGTTPGPQPAEEKAARKGFFGGVPDFIIDRCMDAVSFATGRLGRDAVSADEVADILTERFGIPATRDMVVRAMMAAGQMVVTVRDGGRVLYRVVRPEQEGEAPPPPPPKKPKRRTTTRKKTAAKKKKTVEATPSQIVSDLIALGFFTTARTTTDVVVYLEKKGLEFTARQLTPVMLRLMRAGMLGRKKSDAGEYAYWTE